MSIVAQATHVFPAASLQNIVAPSSRVLPFQYASLVLVAASSESLNLPIRYNSQMDLLTNVAVMKMSAPAWELFVRGILCNLLVCLAVWMTARTNNEAAKIMLIFWCLFAFVGSGFEHMGLALFLPHSETISWIRFSWNQVFVGLGNLVGGTILVGEAYWLSSPYRVTDSVTHQPPNGCP